MKTNRGRPSASARPMSADGDSRISIGNGRRSHCHTDGSRGSADAGHHARHQAGGGDSHVAQLARQLDVSVGGCRVTARPLTT